MKASTSMIAMIALGIAVPMARGELTAEQIEALPPAATMTVDFKGDIKPIFEERCVKCHGRGKIKGGFSLETRDLFLKGGDSGAVVVSGKSEASYLIELVAAVDPDNVMPEKGSRLTAEEVGLLRGWIDQGMAWDEGITFAKPPPVNLQPQKPKLPRVGWRMKHPVDRLLHGYYATNNLTFGDKIDDRRYARRVYLDLVGVLPRPEEMERFLKDSPRKRRGKLVDRLLNDRRRYAEHWMTFWNDLLRNDYRGTGFIDKGRKQISSWLFSSLYDNKPYNQFVAELISPTEDSEGFIKGIVWRGAVNASQKPHMQAAQNVSQVFMGVNLKCASCHDSFIDDWALADSYALASVFSDEALEIYRCDRATGKKADIRFIYPQLGTITTDASREERQEQLANIMTSRLNGRLTRTIVNRLWQRFMGRGLVEPVDDMEQAAWHPDLLDWLAEDLAEHDYNLKHTMKQILTSEAYQRPSVSLSEQPAAEYVFAGPAIRRLSAEQFRDALGSVTGIWFPDPKPTLNFGSQYGEVLEREPRWIWSDARAAEKTEPSTLYWRKTFNLDAVPEEAVVVAACDNRYTLFLNGEKVSDSGDYKEPKWSHVTKRLRKGRNLLAVEARNDKHKDDDPNSPAGLVVYLGMRTGNARKAIVTDDSWVWSRANPEDWQKAETMEGDWQKGHELGGMDAEPWKLRHRFERAASLHEVKGRVRAALVVSDPLMRALGRPPREQLLTTRDDTATTLQALELTNGDTLNRLLQDGANKLLEEKPESTQVLLDRIFNRALSRPPNDEERRAATELVGDPIQKEGVQDLLWIVAMLPEFQLIY